MSAENEVRTTIIELEDSHRYATMEDGELYERVEYWDTQLASPEMKIYPRRLEVVRVIVARQELEIAQRLNELEAQMHNEYDVHHTSA